MSHKVYLNVAMGILDINKLFSKKKKKTVYEQVVPTSINIYPLGFDGSLYINEKVFDI